MFASSFLRSLTMPKSALSKAPEKNKPNDMETQQNTPGRNPQQSEQSSTNDSSHTPIEAESHLQANPPSPATQPAAPAANPTTSRSTKFDHLLAHMERMEETQKADRETHLAKLLRLHRSTSEKLRDLADLAKDTRGVVDCLHDEIKPSNDEEGDHDGEEEGGSLSERIDEIMDELLGLEPRMRGVEEQMTLVRVAEKKEIKGVGEQVGKIGEDVSFLRDELVQHESYRSPMEKRIEERSREVEGKIDEVLQLLKGKRGEGGRPRGIEA